MLVCMIAALVSGAAAGILVGHAKIRGCLGVVFGALIGPVVLTLLCVCWVTAFPPPRRGHADFSGLISFLGWALVASMLGALAGAIMDRQDHPEPGDPPPL